MMILKEIFKTETVCVESNLRKKKLEKLRIGLDDEQELWIDDFQKFFSMKI